MRFILGFYKIQPYLLTRSLSGKNSYFVTQNCYSFLNQNSHLAQTSHNFASFAPLALVVVGLPPCALCCYLWQVSRN